MAFRVFMVAVLALGMFYILRIRNEEQKASQPPPPPPQRIQQADTPFLALDEAQREKIRQAAKDSDPSVRWAAIELMYRIRDPQAFGVLRETISSDWQPAMRKKAVDLLKQAAQQDAKDRPVVIDNLLVALKDPDSQMRIAGLLALGEIGDKRAVPQITGMLSDSDSEVRVQALHALSRLQEKKQAEYEKMAQELRDEYGSQGRPKDRGDAVQTDER